MKILQGTFAYVISTFLVQATSHFAISKAHYAAVGFLRAEPVFLLGILSMLVQGVILTHLYRHYAAGASDWMKGWKFGLLTGAFFVSYPALAEPAKYMVPSVSSWMTTEAIAGFVQFSLFGLTVGRLFRTSDTEASRRSVKVD